MTRALMMPAIVALAAVATTAATASSAHARTVKVRVELPDGTTPPAASVTLHRHPAALQRLRAECDVRPDCVDRALVLLDDKTLRAPWPATATRSTDTGG